MSRSGIDLLDSHLGGLASGRLHLLTGGVGTGKTTACLRFLGAGLQSGEPAVLLTSSRPADVRAQAAFSGVPVDAALRTGRLVALRYRPAFASRIAHALSPRVALDDLRRMMGSLPPTRIAIDPVVPFLLDGSPMGEGLTALGDFLEELGVTALLTYPGDIADGADRRFVGLTERAATVIHLARSNTGALSLAVLRGGRAGATGGPLEFAIAPRSGIVAGPEDGLRALATRTRGSRSASRRLSVVHTTDTVTPEILELLERDYELTVSPLAAMSPANSGGADRVAAIVIETHHSSLEIARSFVRRVAARADGTPIVVVVRFNLRSIDRARLLRAGADEVLATDMSPPELLQRLTAAVSRGHLDQPLVQYSERSLTQAEVSGGRAGLLDRAAFAGALAAHVAHDHPTQYTVVSLAPSRASRGNDDAGTVLARLGEVAMRTARIASGDLVGCFDGRLAVYLHGARRGDASPFVDRVRGAWPARERGSIDVDFLSYPSDEPRLRTLMEASLQ